MRWRRSQPVLGRGSIGGLLVTGLVVVLFAAAYCAREKASGEAGSELVILHAGSLAVPFRQMSAHFNEMHPNAIIRTEAAGSRDTARKVSDLGRRCDVLASADYQVIDNLLIPEYADFSICFARNEMVIAYTDRSQYADVIGGQNWPDVLLEDNVAFGRSDPNRDPCGYRTVMVFQLAEEYYQIPALARRLEEKHGQKYIRPKETDLLALLETGEIDFLFIYRSVASQHRLKFIVLPDEVNLKSTELGDWYARAGVKVTGKRPGEYIERRGGPMVYGLTIPKSCKNRELAEAWVELALSPAGQDIMRRNGQAAIAPALTSQFDMLPESLKPLCRSLSEDE